MLLKVSDDSECYIGADGKRFVRVSRVLQQSGSTRDYSRTDPFYRERGRAVHFGIDLLHRGTLDWTSLDEHTRPFVEGCADFLRISKFKPFAWEVTLGSSHGFAGTIDLLGWLKDRFVLIDYKTGDSVDRAVELQTGGYEILWEENHPERLIDERYYLQLRENGKFSLNKIKTPAWMFLATYYDWRWKQHLPISAPPPTWPFKQPISTTKSEPSMSSTTSPTN